METELIIINRNYVFIGSLKFGCSRRCIIPLLPLFNLIVKI